MSTTGSIRGSWRDVARRCGLAVTTLRRAVERGDVVVARLPEGGIEVDAGQLAQLAGTRLEHAAPVSSDAEADDVASRASEDLPGFLLRALSTSADSAEGDADLEADVAAGNEYAHSEQPTTTSLTMTPLAVHGVGRMSDWLSMFGAPPAAELEQQLAELRTQLATTTAARDGWQRAWRFERVARLSLSEALVAIAAGSAPETVNAIGVAVMQTLSSVPDDVLGSDMAIGIARSAGVQMAGVIEQQLAWQREIERQHRGSDIDRARRARARQRRGIR
jgi:hypothetical protein